MATGSITAIPFPTQRLYNPTADRGRDPTGSDDSGSGYVVGSMWLRTDVGNENAWHCTNATPGSVVWLEVGGAGGSVLPVDDATAVVKGSADATKLVRIEADGLTTGTTRVLNMPDQDVSFGTGVATALAVNVGSAGAPVLFDGALGTPSSGTLTDCTGLPEAGLLDDAVTLAKMASGTAGNLITYDASGNPAAVATGTATHVLTSNGAGAAPTFQAAAGGGGGGDFADGGEAGGADRTLGNTDNFDLGFLTNGSTRLHIQNDGNVGIGTTSPVVPLDIPYTGSDTSVLRAGALEFQSFAINNSFITENLYYGGGNWKYRNDGFGVTFQFTSAGGFAIRSAASGTAGNTATMDSLLSLTRSGYLTLTSSSQAVFYLSGTFAQIQNTAGNFTVNNAANAHIIVKTNNTERMRILNTGKVGIGTNAPADKLEISVGATDAIECMQLEQLDVSEGFINFVATSAASVVNPLTSWTTGNSIQGFLRVEINGTDRYIPFYDAPTA